MSARLSLKENLTFMNQKLCIGKKGKVGKNGFHIGGLVLCYYLEQFRENDDNGTKKLHPFRLLMSNLPGSKCNI